MTSFATVEDLGTYLGQDFDEAMDIAQAQALLDRATADIQAFTHQTISELTETISVDAPVLGAVVLPQWPVTAVAAVSQDGVVLGSSDFVFYRNGVVKRSNGVSWGSKPNSLTFVYTHGYSVIPGELKGVCMARASRLLANPDHVTSESMGSYRYTSDTSEQFTETEESILGGYMAVSVA